jgi:hypothetical protein
MKFHRFPLAVPVLCALSATYGIAQSVQVPNPVESRPRSVTSAPPTDTLQTQNSAPAGKQGEQTRPAAGASVPVGPPEVVAPPMILPPPIVTPKPVKPISVSEFRSKVAEADRALKTRPVLTSYSTSGLSTITMAAMEPGVSQVHLISLSKDVFLTKGANLMLTTSLGKLVHFEVIRANGVNTAVQIYDETGKSFIPILVQYPIEKFGTFRENAYYTSAHPALLSPEVVKTGQNYVRTMIDLAAGRLKMSGIVISPSVLDVAERLCIVEHTDHDRFRRENRKMLFDEIFSLYTLNQLDTYRYSVSTAGAGGMVQMIPATYLMMRNAHPGAGLNPDFVAGMRNHGNALEAMLLYMQDTWNGLVLNPDIAQALATGIATQPELMAAGYNSNPAKLPSYIRRGGTSWRTLIPRETQMYLQIYQSLTSFVPMKPRNAPQSLLSEAQTAK